MRLKKREAMAMKKIRSMVNSYKIDAISIGNGTASHENNSLRKLLLTKQFRFFIVRMKQNIGLFGIKIAVRNFPNYDVTVRGSFLSSD
jgi:uncharacterized protein